MFFFNKLIFISYMLCATFHVEWLPLKVCSLSNKGINNNNCSLFLGLDVCYNAHNKLYEIFSFFPKIFNVKSCNKFNKRNVK